MKNTDSTLNQLCKIVCSIFWIYAGLVNAQNQDSMIREMKGGNYFPDTSYMYQLPFQPGQKIRLIQGYRSIFSHSNEFSSDFKTKIGTKVFAARPGVVTQTKSDSKVGGLGDEFLSQGNHVVVLHEDGSFAAYWHLQFEGALVKVGDTVTAGQMIGLSGNTGYSAFPHVHFMVYKYENFEQQTLPIRFKTQKGVRYLRPGRRYCRPKTE